MPVLGATPLPSLRSRVDVLSLIRNRVIVIRWFALPANPSMDAGMFSALSPRANFLVRIALTFGAGLLIAGLL